MIDILLHQSGHIMLSDFDLSKQSGEPGGAPATIKSGGPNGVSYFLLILGNELMIDDVSRYQIMYCRL